MSWDELELLLLLSSGDAIEAKNSSTGQYWRGTVDAVVAGQGKLWMFAELGERKLIDLEEHTISIPARAGHLRPQATRRASR